MRTVGLLDHQGIGIGERADSLVLGDLVLLHQEVHTGHAPLGDLATAVERGAKIEGGLATDTKGLGFLGEDVGQLRVPQQCLGRDTPDIEANSAPILLLDDGCLQTQLGGANGRDITTGTGSENDDVIVCSHEPHTSRTAIGRESELPLAKGGKSRNYALSRYWMPQLRSGSGHSDFTPGTEGAVHAT